MLDILGVYVVLFSLIAVGVASAWRGSMPEPLVTISVWISAFCAGIFRNDVRIAGFKALDSTYVVVGCVALGGLLAILCYRRVSDRNRYLRGLGVLIFASGLAFVGGITDRFGGIWANPAALVQGHAVWHTFGAVALLASYELFAMTGYDRSVFSTSKKPNKVPEPTTMAVTPRATS